MKRFWRYLAIISVLPLVMVAMSWFSQEPYTGFIADPVQANLGGAEVMLLPVGDDYVQMSLLAKYSIEAVVKSKNGQSDYPSRISKYDLALAWGTLNDPDIDAHITYGQSGRFYFYRWSEGTPVSPEYIATHSANVHVIHSSQAVLKDIRALGRKDHIRLNGFLVNVNFQDGAWKTSLTRNDTGNGSCEIMYVTDIQVLEN